MESSWMWKDPSEHEPFNPMRRSIPNDSVAHIFHHSSELDSGRTSCLAGATVETTKHVLVERVRDRGASFVIRPHQIDSASRRIGFRTKHAIRRTRWETEAAMNAVEIQLL